MSVQGAQNRRVWFRVDWERREKTCSRCLKTKTFDDFYLFTDRGRERVSSMCKPCTRRYQVRRNEMLRNGPPRRMPRYNDRGQAWCPNCRQYLSQDNFRPHPSRAGQLWSYCKPCVIELDRMRYRYGDPAKKRAATQRNVQLARQRRRAAKQEREAFVRNAISTLKRRGFTRADICAMGRFGQGNVIEWETGVRRDHGIQPAIERTFGALLRLTADYAAGPREKKGGRPHPDLPRLVAEMDAIWPELGRKRRTPRGKKA